MIKIAIPTNDRINITERSGRAIEFMVVDIENAKIISKEYRKNNHKHDHEENSGVGKHEHNHNDLAGLLFDCKYILAKIIGKHFKKDLSAAGKIFILTKEENIEKAITMNLNQFI